MILTHLIFFFFDKILDKIGKAISLDVSKFNAIASNSIVFRSECFDKSILISTQLDDNAFNIYCSDQHNFISEVKDDQLISNW